LSLHGFRGERGADEIDCTGWCWVHGKTLRRNNGGECGGITEVERAEVQWRRKGEE